MVDSTHSIYFEEEVVCGGQKEATGWAAGDGRVTGGAVGLSHSCNFNSTQIIIPDFPSQLLSG